MIGTIMASGSSGAPAEHPGALDEAFQELVLHPIDHDDPIHGDADLAMAQEPAEDRGFDRMVEIGTQA